jgi:hypothetical protein
MFFQVFRVSYEGVFTWIKLSIALNKVKMFGAAFQGKRIRLQRSVAAVCFS